jgi:hypothetical protein
MNCGCFKRENNVQQAETGDVSSRQCSMGKQPIVALATVDSSAITHDNTVYAAQERITLCVE